LPETIDMPVTRANLFYNDYRWSAREERDDPRVTGNPDSTLLDRNEGYEVLYFVNAVGRRNWTPEANLATCHKIERMVRACPGAIRSQQRIEQWILDHWNQYP
jgi:hypothetical protein